MPSRDEKDLMSNYMRGTGDTYRDAVKNPKKYTTSQPNNSSKPAYFTTHHSGKNKGEKIYHYKVEKPKTVTRTVYKNRPVAAKSKPKPQAAPKPIEYSSEIQQAKDRVNAYENGKSPWEQAQANVKSSFIKNTGSSSNDQYDFSGNTFDANQSSKPNEQAQAAQNQMQNYISKYSSFKSNTN